MLNGSANLIICEGIHYKSVKFHYYLSLWDSKSVFYIRKFVIFEFVITEKLCKDLIKILPGF